MNDVTQKQRDEALANCPWLSQNRQGYTLIPDICTGACLPCANVIERGQCDTLIELFHGKSGNAKELKKELK